MIAFLSADLQQDESCRLRAYPDPKSKTGKPVTIGWGHTGPEVYLGLIWTQAQADAALAQDIEEACSDLDMHLPWWRTLCEARQSVLAQLSFNMGIGRLLGFKKTIAALKAQDWAMAAAEILDSDAARSLPTRYQRMAKQMHDGVRIPA